MPSGRVPVYPIYSEAMDKEVEQEEGQAFYREKINEVLRFCREDFDLINTVDFGFRFFVHIDQKIGLNDWVVDWWVGSFTKTDCEWFPRDRRVEVLPDPEDVYKAILDNMEKELDLIQIAPAIVKLDLKIQPLVQLYILGSEVVTNIVSGTWFEQPVKNVVTNSVTLVNDYFFSGGATLGAVPGEPGVLIPDVSGFYDYSSLDRISDLKYRFLEQDLGSGNQWTIIDQDNANQVVYTAPVGEPLNGDLEHSSLGALFTSILDPASTCRFFRARMFGRILTDNQQFNGVNTNPIPLDDIVEANENYSRTIGLNYPGFLVSYNNSVDPTRFGRFSSDAANFSDRYFDIVDSVPEAVSYYPVHRSEWTGVSFWFYYNDDLRNFQEDEAVDYQIRNAYLLSDVIKAILREIAPDITHEGTAVYSDFLYSLSNPLRPSKQVPVIVPKSNIVIGEYDQPAQRALFRPSDFFRFLEEFYQCKWIIDSENRLVIEQIIFFYNGGSYTEEIASSDLTTLIEPKTGKRWSFATDSYKFDKGELPVQIYHKWMDEVSEPFQGFPIDMLSPYVQQGNYEERNISMFTSDIDFAQAQPGSISKDGFFFFEASEVGGIYKVAFVEFTLDGYAFYKMQNGFASIVYAHDKYWRFNLPCSSVRLNLEEIEATTVKRTRISEIEFPISDDFDPIQLITTEFGNGKISKISINFTSGAARTTLKNGTED